MHHLNLTSVLGLAFSLLLTTGRALGEEPFVIVEKSSDFGGTNHSILITRADPSALEKFAADEFVDYICRASEQGTRLLRGSGQAPADFRGPVILLGIAGKAPFADLDPTKLPTNGFRIRSSPQKLEIIGQTAQGASNGIYWLLWQKIGVRWFMPTRLGEEVPVLKRITVQSMDYTGGPSFPATSFDVHFLGSSANRTRSGGAQLDFNSRHVWSEVVGPTPKNHAEHPEWFALTKRKEMPKEPWMNFIWKDKQGNIRSDQLCTTDPHVLKMFIAYAQKYFKDNPDAKMVSVEPNDNHEFCTCARCQQLDKKLGDGPLMNRLMHFFNQIAAEVRKDFPDRKLGVYAYSSHVDPPTTVKPDPMVVPTLAFFASRACYQHAIDDPTCERNAQWKRQIFDPWTKLSPKVGYYSYHAYTGSWQGPNLMVRTMPRDLKLFHKHGCIFFHVDGWANWATCAPTYYLLRRLSWDVNADPAALLDEWYRGMYGPAYEPMKQYWETMIDGYYQGPHQSHAPTHPHLMFTRDVIKKAWPQIHAAEKAIDKAADRYQRRVSIAKVGLEYTDAMALGFLLAEQKKWPEAIAAGRKARAVIVSSRAREPAPYIAPLWPRDELTWLWYRAWDHSNSSEIMTQGIIDKWEKQK